jgi:predicted phosphodiesterase
MQVYPIADPHIGMLSWAPETGESNDLRIGVDRVENGIGRLISLAPPAEVAAIVNTGDFFHMDDQRNATPASGHQLDVDGRAHKVKRAGVQLLRRAIDFALQKHRRVIVKNLKGNHDPESAAWLNIALGLFYSNEPRVEIDLDDGNNDIWLHLFGANYIGATHGHTMKPERMAMVMADDRPDYWGASKYRWMIFGHIHHETVKEVGSVRCESFRQPVPKDAYAHSHGYRAGNSMSSVTLHREAGEIGRHKINFAPVRMA